jgi:uncharacterized lipoprotein YmbA
MKKRISALLLLSLLAAGCGTPSNYYRLEPASGSALYSHRIPTKIIGIANVELADYLEGKQLISRKSENRIDIDENEAWAGDLAKNIQSFLRSSLASRVHGYSFLSTPWKEPVDDRYRIFLKIERMDTDPSGRVVIQGRWSIADMQERKIVTGEEFSYAENSTSMHWDDIVKTQSGILEKLSAKIATAISKID